MKLCLRDLKFDTLGFEICNCISNNCLFMEVRIYKIKVCTNHG